MRHYLIVGTQYYWYSNAVFFLNGPYAILRIPTPYYIDVSEIELKIA